MKTIDVLYKCSCMSKEASFQVRARREGEDIRDWMHNVMEVGLFLDHKRRSPRCRADRTEYVKIPTGDEVPLGAKPETRH